MNPSGTPTFSSNWQYRNYLIHNATSIMKESFEEASRESGFVKQFNKQPISSFSTPYLYKDDKKAKGYQSSDLKNSYLSQIGNEGKSLTFGHRGV